MTISRLVIVPEFQGFGIGIKFMNIIAEIYNNNRIRVTTSLKSFIVALNKQNEWKCVRFGRVGKPGKNGVYEEGSMSANRITATFQYER